MVVFTGDIYFLKISGEYLKRMFELNENFFFNLLKYF